MPKGTRYKNAIPRLYRRGHIETTLFAWVTCAQSYFPTLSVENSLQNWYSHFDINPEDYPMNTAIITFNRMKKELIYKDKDEKDNKLD